MKKTRTAELFDILSKGQFISSNAVDEDRRYNYKYLDENQDKLSPKFEEIGFQLNSGNNYFYFSKPTETNQGIENKIEKALRWLNILAFFTTFRKDLCRGARFSAYDILPKIEINLALKDQLNDLQKRNGSQKAHHEKLNDLLKEMQKEGFIDLENEMEQQWKVLDAWEYMEKMVMAVNIYENDEVEISSKE
jgi:hypothetical protein